MSILNKVSDTLQYLLGVKQEFSNPVEVIKFINEFKYNALFPHLAMESVYNGGLPLENFDGSEAQVYCKSHPRIQSFCTFTGPIVFGKNVRVGPYCFLRGPLVIGDNVLIGPYAEIARTVVLNDAVLAHRNSIMDSIIGARVELAGFVYICNRHVNNVMRVCYGKERIVHEGRFGATIEDDVYVGAAAGIMPGAHIPSGRKYPGPCIIHSVGKHRWEIPFSSGD